MADPSDPGDAGLHSSPSCHRSNIRPQTFIAVRASLAEMVSNSTATARPFHRARPTPRTLSQRYGMNSEANLPGASVEVTSMRLLWDLQHALAKALSSLGGTPKRAIRDSYYFYAAVHMNRI